MVRRRWSTHATVALLAVLWLIGSLGGLVTACGGDREVPADRPPGSAAVHRIVDGDTIVVELEGREEKVRLIGIDTPESVDPRRPVQCFGKEAGAHTGELIPPGTAVRLVLDVEARDRYGRLLAYVYRLSDDLFVNVAIARDGYAQALTVPPNVAHSSEFVAAVAEAREAGRGLWSGCPHE